MQWEQCHQLQLEAAKWDGAVRDAFLERVKLAHAEGAASTYGLCDIHDCSADCTTVTRTLITIATIITAIVARWYSHRVDADADADADTDSDADYDSDSDFADAADTADTADTTDTADTADTTDTGALVDLRGSYGPVHPQPHPQPHPPPQPEYGVDGVV
jgi:hypothetical protein